MKSLTIVGGTGFFGKSFIENFQQNKLQKYGINKLIIISRGKIKFSKKLRKNIQILRYNDFYIIRRNFFSFTKCNRNIYIAFILYAC